MVTPKKNNLIYSNKSLSFQNKEKEKQLAQLNSIHLELENKTQEIAKLKAELVIANLEPTIQNNEKEKRAAELIIANKELAFQNDEKEKRAIELIIANKELAFQNDEKEKRATELVIANTELAFQNDEKEKRAAELMLTNIELKNAEESQREYIRGLEKITFMTSHQVRQPIANILGLSLIIDLQNDSKEEIQKSIDYIKQSALSLDILTRELNAHVLYLQKKVKI